MVDRILLTGGLGQVGSYICEELVSRGHIVTILDNLSSAVNPYPPEANFVKGDIRDAGLINMLTSSIRPFNIYCPARVTRIAEMAIPLACRCSRVLLSYSPILYPYNLIRHIRHRQPV